MEDHAWEQHPSNDPTMRKYQIRAKVKVVRATAQQGLVGGHSEFDAVLLLPQEGDSTTSFYAAWLPDESNHHHEIILELGHPVYGTARAAVLRSGKFYQTPHIFIMSKGVEDILKKMDTQILSPVTVLPCNLDYMGDAAVDTDVEIVKYE